MIEFPKVGEGSDVELQENMVFSMHPHAIAANGEDCLYMQDTWLVTAAGRRSARRPRDGDLGRREPSASTPAATGYNAAVTWPWIVLLAIGIGVVVAAEWPRFERLAGADARRQREREKRKSKLRVVVERRRRVRAQRPGRPRGAADDRGARDPEVAAVTGFSLSPAALADDDRRREHPRVGQDRRHVLHVARLLVVGDLHPEPVRPPLEPRGRDPTALHWPFLVAMAWAAPAGVRPSTETLTVERSIPEPASAMSTRTAAPRRTRACVELQRRRLRVVDPVPEREAPAPAAVALSKTMS